MLAFIDNFKLSEGIIIAIVAVLIFGKRLPQVAGQAAAHVARARRALNELWRDSGLEEEMRKVQREVDRSKSGFPMLPSARRAAGAEPRRTVLAPPSGDDPAHDPELVVRPPEPQPPHSDPDPGPSAPQATPRPDDAHREH